MNQITFAELKLIEPIQRSLKAADYSHPTPIQLEAIPHLLGGGDLLGCAQTGTGKTAAFALPMLQRLHKTNSQNKKNSARSLVLTPTRELAVQIYDNFKKYGKNLKQRTAVIYGGVRQGKQVRSIEPGVDVLIATPGRLLDLINQGHVSLRGLEILVLDEADRMLDMGFIRDVKKILALIPNKRQTLLFSATMPKEVAHLAESVLNQPKKIQIDPVISTADLIEDKVLYLEHQDKKAALLEIIRTDEVKRTIIFTRTKHGANRLARQLNDKRIRAEAIHGNKAQNARQKALKDFSSGKVKVLVATDIVSRGIDVSGITHVINYDLPNEPESYVHRIGRTARAGTSGIALSLCNREELEYLADIEKLLQRTIEAYREHSFHSEEIEMLKGQAKQKKQKAKRKRRPPRNRPRGGSGERSPRQKNSRRKLHSKAKKPRTRVSA